MNFTIHSYWNSYSTWNGEKSFPIRRPQNSAQVGRTGSCRFKLINVTNILNLSECIATSHYQKNKYTFKNSFDYVLVGSEVNFERIYFIF